MTTTTNIKNNIPQSVGKDLVLVDRSLLQGLIDIESGKIVGLDEKKILELLE